MSDKMRKTYQNMSPEIIKLFQHFTDDEITKIEAIENDELDIFEDQQLYEKLYEYFVNRMPYCVQKCKCSTPDEFIYHELENLLEI